MGKVKSVRLYEEPDSNPGLIYLHIVGLVVSDPGKMPGKTGSGFDFWLNKMHAGLRIRSSE
jgi:hypothetical protein